MADEEPKEVELPLPPVELFLEFLEEWMELTDEEEESPLQSTSGEFLDESFFELVFMLTPEDEAVLLEDDLGSKIYNIL